MCIAPSIRIKLLVYCFPSMTIIPTLISIRTHYLKLIVIEWREGEGGGLNAATIVILRASATFSPDCL